MLNKNIKSVRFLIIFLGAVACHGSHAMSDMRNLLGSLINAPTTMSSVFNKITVCSWFGVNHTKNSAKELIRDSSHATAERIEDINQGIESHISNAGLCSVAAFSAGLGVYHAINNIDADKKPEQSARKLWFGTGLAFFSTAFLYTKYRGIENKRAQRALNRPNTPSAAPVTPSQAAMPTAAISSLTTTTTTTTTTTSASTVTNQRQPSMTSSSFSFAG